jgi:hypothetical protein
VLDRGDQELQIFHFLERLQHQARKAGGDVHVLNGNHETINVEGRFTYVTPGARVQFDRLVEGLLYPFAGERARMPDCLLV